MQVEAALVLEFVPGSRAAPLTLKLQQECCPSGSTRLGLTPFIYLGFLQSIPHFEELHRLRQAIHLPPGAGLALPAPLDTPTFWVGHPLEFPPKLPAELSRLLGGKLLAAPANSLYHGLPSGCLVLGCFDGEAAQLAAPPPEIPPSQFPLDKLLLSCMVVRHQSTAGGFSLSQDFCHGLSLFRGQPFS